MRIAIIGAGMAGLACARALAAADQTVVIYDKGGGVGGRMATRRADGGLQFDHGAQFVTAREPAFADLLDEIVTAGYADQWEIPGMDDDKRRFVGLPGMTGLAKYLAKGLEVHRRTTVTALQSDASGCQVEVGEQSASFDRIVCTAPAPQAIALLGEDHSLAGRLRTITYDPCLTLMIGLGRRLANRPEVRSDKDADLSWIARDSSKPNRGSGEAWVAHASPDWSRQHLEMGPKEMATRLTTLFVEAMEADSDRITHTEAHRWRYSRVSSPLGEPFLEGDGGRLFVGGDGCLGARVEAAFLSGTAIAEAILEGR